MPSTPTEHVLIEADGLKLEGVLTTPAAATRAAVICHPHPQYGGTMDNHVVVAAADALARAWVATLRFNFRGVGASQGRYDNGRGEAADALAGVKFLSDRVGTRAVTLAGYSFGAMVALRAAHDSEAVASVVAIAPPLAMFDASFLDDSTKPHLFVLGDDDQYCPMHSMQAHLRSLPAQTAFVAIAGADHFFFGYEAQVADAVVRFVTESR
jgi:hypothetical protein